MTEIGNLIKTRTAGHENPGSDPLPVLIECRNQKLADHKDKIKQILSSLKNRIFNDMEEVDRFIEKKRQVIENIENFKNKILDYFIEALKILNPNLSLTENFHISDEKSLSETDKERVRKITEDLKSLDTLKKHSYEILLSNWILETLSDAEKDLEPFKNFFKEIQKHENGVRQAIDQFKNDASQSNTLLYKILNIKTMLSCFISGNMPN